MESYTNLDCSEVAEIGQQVAVAVPPDGLPFNGEWIVVAAKGFTFYHAGTIELGGNSASLPQETWVKNFEGPYEL